MKFYDLRFSVSVGHSVNYTTEYALRFEINEKLPANADPEKYIRKRISEELNRHFQAMTEEIDNKTEEAKKATDPLDDDCPF